MQTGLTRLIIDLDYCLSKVNDLVYKYIYIKKINDRKK